MDKENSLTRGEEEDEDPVEFLLQNKEYHDWTVTVKDPSTGTQKDFGVSSQNLVAHSKVFRTSMSDPKWVKEKKLVIPNMSHQTFDLIYRFVNAGDLGLQKISQEDLADLVLAADMYMLPRLVKKACKYLIPASAEDIFPALTVVSFIPNTDLEPHVSKLVQLNTEEIMVSVKFLRLDRRCIEFIVQQEVLSLPEIEVWKHLVNWANHQVGDDGKKTLRSVLGKSLKYIRFCTMTHEDIVKEVAPTNILTGDELASLFCAVISKQPWNQPELCNSQTARQPNSCTDTNQPVDKVECFKVIRSYHSMEYLRSVSQTNESYLFIEAKTDIELRSLVLMAKPLSELGGKQFYNMECNVTVKKRGIDKYPVVYEVTSTKEVHGEEKEVTVSMMTQNNQYVKLEANNKYHFAVYMSLPHMTFDIGYWGQRSTFISTKEMRKYKNDITVQFVSPIHILEIHYKILS